jgi:hypothetical protein
LDEDAFPGEIPDLYITATSSWSLVTTSWRLAQVEKFLGTEKRRLCDFQIRGVMAFCLLHDFTMLINVTQISELGQIF